MPRRPAPPAPADLAARAQATGTACLAFAARRTANLLARAYAGAMAPTGLEMPQFAILCAVAAGRAGSGRELAAALGLERSTLTRTLGHLLRAGLVAAAPGPGRRIGYRLTAAGEARLDEALPRWDAAQAAVLHRLPAGAADDARRALASLRRAARDVIGPEA